MRNSILAGAGALALLLTAAAPASAGVVFESTFENTIPYGSWTPVGAVDGWTGAPLIELQNHVAGSPAPTGGNVFVELDANSNSAMFRTIAAGTYDLSFLYSPRPGVGAGSNGITVSIGETPLSIFLNGGLVPSPLTGAGGGETIWNTYTSHFTVAADTVLTFAAVGTSDSLGGYVDNIKLTAVPESATWAMMIMGFASIGAALRSRRPASAHVFG